MARASASPYRIHKDHQNALEPLERILRTTRQDWMLDVLPVEPARQAPASRPRV